MPEDLFPWEFEPVETRRKKFIQQGGLGNDLNGWKNPREKKQYICVHCRKRYEWKPDLESTDYGDVVDNLCSDCRRELRTMRTNHPEMK